MYCSQCGRPLNKNGSCPACSAGTVNPAAATTATARKPLTSYAWIGPIVAVISTVLYTYLFFKRDLLEFINFELLKHAVDYNESYLIAASNIIAGVFVVVLPCMFSFYSSEFFPSNKANFVGGASANKKRLKLRRFYSTFSRPRCQAFFTSFTKKLLHEVPCNSNTCLIFHQIAGNTVTKTSQTCNIICLILLKFWLKFFTRSQNHLFWHKRVCHLLSK